MTTLHQESGGRGGLRQGGAGGDPGVVHAPVDGRRRNSRWTSPAASGSCTSARSPGRPGPPRAGRGAEVERGPRERRAGHDLPRPGGDDRPAPPRSQGGHPHLRTGRHQARDDHRRPSADRGSRGPRVGVAQRRPRGHRPGVGDLERRRAGAGGGRDRGLCPRVAGPQVAGRHRLAEARPHRGHDRRRGERRPGAEEGRRGHRHGDHRHGRQPRGRRHDADRRQLRLDRRRHRGRPRHFRKHQEVPDVPAVLEHRRDRPDGRSHAGRICRCR